MSGPRTGDLGPTVRVPLAIIQRVLDLVEMLRRKPASEVREIADTIEEIIKPYDDPDAAQLDEIARLGT
jgi:hypothetical protein